MPTTYTHDVFGKSVYQKLPEELKQIIERERNAYRIGLHGPDILFYYRPYFKNPVNQKGHEMHKANAAQFFRECKKHYFDTKNETFLAYVIGFICHYMLDSTCHPFIIDYMEKTGARHDEIETDLDRVLMEMNGKNPFRYHPAKHFHVDCRTVKAISEAFDGISERQIRKALRSTRFYTSILVCSNPFQRLPLTRLLHLTGLYKEVQGRMIMKKRNKRYLESTKRLLDLSRLAVPETVTVIEDFWETVENGQYLNYRFERNYLEMNPA